MIRLHVYRTTHPLFLQVFFHFGHSLMHFLQLLNQKLSVKVLNLSGYGVTFLLDGDGFFVEFSDFLVLFEDQNFVLAEDAFDSFLDFGGVFVVRVDIL